MSKRIEDSWRRCATVTVLPLYRVAEGPVHKGRLGALGTYARVALVGGLLTAICSGPVRDARADIAPPGQPPGSNLAPAAEITNVVMTSESVLLTVQPTPWAGAFAAEEENRGATRDWARVEAHFVMRNTGTQSEAMAGRFPLSAPLNYEPPAGG